MFSEEQLNVIEYCAQECVRQGSGEASVYNMVNAWDFADYLPDKLTSELIEHIGKLVEPMDNQHGFRTIPIYVGNSWSMVEKSPWERVPELLTLLLGSYYEEKLFDPDDVGYYGQNPLSQSMEDEFYFQYENIHPFRDGNGRSGKILYNYLCGTLENPIMPPNFWESSNP